MRVLVTGGAGFLGRKIVEKLQGQGHSVSVLGRGDYPELKQQGINTIKADVANEQQVINACSNQDMVFHVAAKAGYWGSYDDYFKSNVVGTKNILKACQQQGVSKLIYTSTPSVAFDGHDLSGVDESTPYAKNPLTHYQKTKIQAEKLILSSNGESGVETVALRPHIIWGPGDNHIIPRLLQRARAGRLKIIGNGQNKVGTIYVDDAAEAHLQAALSSNTAGKAYFITQQEPVNFWDWINLIITEFGLPKIESHVPFQLAYGLGGLLEKVYGSFKIPGEPIMTRFLAEQLAKSHYFNISNAKRDFGFNPQTSVKQGVENLRRAC